MKKTFERNFAGKSTYTCQECGILTRETGSSESGCELCLYCYEIAGEENALQDGNTTQEEFDAFVLIMQKAYKRGADGKPLPVVAKGVKVTKPFSPTTKKIETGANGNDVSVVVGKGIVQVLQLDDPQNVATYRVVVTPKNKEQVTLTGSVVALDMFRQTCEQRISSDYDQPLWYMSSAKATADRIVKTLTALGHR